MGIKVLHVAPHFWPATDFGGMPEAALQLCRALVHRGLSVEVATTDILTRRKRLEAPYPVDALVQIRRSRVLAPRIAAWLDFYVCADQVRVKREFFDAFDIVHFHGARGFQNAIWTGKISNRGVPAILQPHGSMSYVGGKRPAKILYDMAAGWRTYRAYRRIIALSKGEAIDIAEFGVPRDRISVLPNGVDPRSFQEKPERGALRTLLGIQDDSLVFTFLGRVNRLKGLDVLVPAFAKTARRNPKLKIHLIIAGPSSSFSTALPHLIRRNDGGHLITLLGHVGGQSKAQLLADTDWLVVPSHYEAFSIALLEAAAFGIPAILSTASRFDDFITNGAALPADPEIESLAGAIKAAAENPDLRDRLGRKAQKEVLVRFTWETIAESAERLYCQAMAN